MAITERVNNMSVMKSTPLCDFCIIAYRELIFDIFRIERYIFLSDIGKAESRYNKGVLSIQMSKIPVCTISR